MVLGATGFIGRRVMAALAATDWAEPVAASRRTLDATDADSLSGALRGVDGLVNCVAGDAGVIVKNAAAVRAAAERSEVRPRVVHLSSMAAYGSVVGDVDESAALRGDLDDYSQAKATAEKTLAGYPAAVILRPGIVYGPQSPWWSDRIARLLVARRLGDLGAAGDGFCNLVHVDDVAAAIVSALRTPAVDGEAFNLAMPDPPTWNGYFLRYAKALGAVPLRRISRRRLAAERKLLAPALKILEIAAGVARSAARAPPPIPALAADAVPARDPAAGVEGGTRIGHEMEGSGTTG